jgi:hypothetical protein
MRQATMKKICDGSDKLHEEQTEGAKYGNYRERIGYFSRRMGVPWSGRVGRSTIEVFVDHGRWLAQCECGGAEYVTPEDPIFYCCSCGNENVNGAARRVIFPENKGEIETALLERVVMVVQGKTETARAAMSTPALPGVTRSWRPGETTGQLREQHLAAITYAETLRERKRK